MWEYYPGQGIELQVLATFGKADGLYTAGPSDYPQMEALLAQMIPLAVNRGGGLVWEYYFQFGGGKPPWTSAMSQGTGIEALTRAYLASHDTSYLGLAHQALALFTAPPPIGVRVPTAVGARYVQYTFTPGTSIINAFLQSLIGLYDYAQASHDPLAQQLFDAGNAEAEAEVPHFDTGAWSLYQPGVEDTLSYHELVTGFLQQLCQRTAAPVYCTAAQHFTAYLKTPPALQLLTQHVAQGQAGDDPVLAIEGLPGRHRGDRPRRPHAVRDQRRLRLRHALVRRAGPQAQGDLHDPPGRHRPGRELQPDRRDNSGPLIGAHTRHGHPRNLRISYLQNLPTEGSLADRGRLRIRGVLFHATVARSGVDWQEMHVRDGP